MFNKIAIVALVFLTFLSNDLKSINLSNNPQVDSSVIYVKIRNKNHLKKWIWKKGGSNKSTHPFGSNLDSFEIEKITQPFGYTGFDSLTCFLKIENKLKKNHFKLHGKLKKMQYVEHIEYSKVVEPIALSGVDTSENIIWHENVLNLTKAHTITQGDSNVVIAVVDFIFNDKLTDLVGKWWNNPNEIPNDNIDNDSNGFVDDLHGWNFGANSNNAFFILPNIPDEVIERYNHGTMVASLVAGKRGNTNSTIGACPGCRIMPLNLQMLDEASVNPKWEAHAVNQNEAMVYAAYNGADIINCSWGRLADSISNLESQIYFYCDSMGSILVAGAGNNGKILEHQIETKKFYPANDSRFITVGSISKDLYKSQFSNCEPLTKVDILAPGDNILVGGRKNSNTFFQASGTSLSAPLISGILGLIKSYYPNASREDIKNILYDNCNSIDYKNFGETGKNGHGIPNAFSALSSCQKIRSDFFTHSLEQINYKDSWVKFHCVSFPNGKYVWDWGDGTTSVTNIPEINKKYHNEGIYTISLISKDTISNFADTISKSDWFSICKYEISLNDYNRNWVFGSKYLLNFGMQNKKLSKNVLQPIIGSNPCITPLGQDSFFVFANFKDDFGSGTSVVNRDLVISNEEKSLIDTALYKNLQKNSIFQSVNNIQNALESGYIIPDLISDSLLFFQLANVTEVNNFLPFRYYKITENLNFKLGKVKFPPSYLSDHDSIDKYIIFPNYDSNYYWLLCRPLNVSDHAKGDYFHLYKLHVNKGKLEFLFMKHLFTYDSLLVYSRLFNSMVIAPNGNRIIIEYDTIVLVYDFQNALGDFSLIHKFKINGFSNLTKSGNLVFNHDGSKIYGAQATESSHIFELFQIDLNSNSFELKPVIIERGYSNQYVNLINGPDKMIYINNAFGNNLSIITKPDAVLSADYSNEVGFVSYGLDLNTKIPLNSREENDNSIIGLPIQVFQNIDDSIYFKYKLINCDSIQLSSNFPSRIFHRWILNGKDTLSSLNPVAKINLVDSNKIELVCNKLKVIKYVSFKDSFNRTNIKIHGSTSNVFNLIGPYDPITIKFDTTTAYRFTDSVIWYNKFGFHMSKLIYDTITLNLPGIYFATLKNNCFSKEYGPIEIKLPCTSNVYNLNYLNYSGLWKNLTGKDTGVVLFNGNYTIGSNDSLRLNNCIVLFNGNSSLNIQKGGKIIAKNTKFISCSTWKGIKIWGDPLISSGRNVYSLSHGVGEFENCEFNNAETAIESNDGGFLKLTNCKFIDNTHHLNVFNYNFSHLSNIHNNLFSIVNQNDTILNSVGCFAVNGGNVHHQLCLKNIKDQVINENLFELPQIINNSFLSSVKNKSINLILHKTDSINILENSFWGGYNNILVYDTLGKLNKFINNDFKQKLSNNNRPFLFNNQFTGILMKHADSNLIDRNLFQNCLNGIEFYSLDSLKNTSRIERNRIKVCDFGVISANKVNPTKPNFFNLNKRVNLSVMCNTFDSCNYAWIGTGTHPHQGSSSGFVSGNEFYHANFQNVLVLDHAHDYCFNKFLAEQICTTTLSFSLSLDNIMVSQANLLSKNFNLVTVYTNNCSGKRFKTLSNDYLNSEPINIYPNPFNPSFDIAGDFLNVSNILIYNSYGALILSGNSRYWNLKDHPDGLYYLKLIFNDASSKSIKIIKN